jgi:uridine kinase
MTPDRSRCLQALASLILRVGGLHPVRVAIDGPDAAGKTTLADELARMIERSGHPVIRASLDGFHRTRAQRLARGPESPEGYFLDSFDYPALRRALLDPLGPGGNREFRRSVFDFRIDAPVVAPTELAPANAVLLFDGVFLLRDELVDLWDFSMFLAVSFDETQRRAVARDVTLFGGEDEVRHRYEVRYVPGQQLYYSQVHPQEYADVVVDNEDPDRPRFTAGVSDG